MSMKNLLLASAGLATTSSKLTPVASWSQVYSPNPLVQWYSYNGTNHYSSNVTGPWFAGGKFWISANPVNYNLAANQVYTSTDGVGWSQHAQIAGVLGSTYRLVGMTETTPGVIVALGYRIYDWTPVILRSTDNGDNWGVSYIASIAVGSANSGWVIRYLNGALIFTSNTGSVGDPAHIFTSFDNGSTFSIQAIYPSNSQSMVQLNDVAYGNNSFIAIGFNSDFTNSVDFSTILTHCEFLSSNGVSWYGSGALQNALGTYTGMFTTGVMCLIYSAKLNLFVGMDMHTGKTIYSSNGAYWGVSTSFQASGFTGDQLSTQAFAIEKDGFIIMQANGKVGTSTDGVNWGNFSDPFTQLGNSPGLFDDRQIAWNKQKTILMTGFVVSGNNYIGTVIKGTLS